MLRKNELVNLKNKHSDLKEEKPQFTNYLAPDPYPPTSITGISFIDECLRRLGAISSFRLQSVGRLVLPALSRSPVLVKTEQMRDLEFHYSERIISSKVITYDNAELDTIEINHQENISPIYIIKFNGNGFLFEDNLPQLMDDAYRLKANVIAFNYRGVGKSLKVPESINDLVTDGIAEVQQILDRKVLPKHIILDGLSLGGGVATLVAKYFHDQGIKINLFNDRSFSSISSAGAHMIVRRELSPIAEYSLESTASSLVYFSGWQINAARAYATIPSANKAYMYVTDDMSLKGNQGDLVIPEKASLHESLKNSPAKQGEFYKMTCMLMRGGHTSARQDLHHVTDEELNGQKVFDGFVARVTR